MNGSSMREKKGDCSHHHRDKGHAPQKWRSKHLLIRPCSKALSNRILNQPGDYHVGTRAQLGIHREEEIELLLTVLVPPAVTSSARSSFSNTGEDGAMLSLM